MNLTSQGSYSEVPTSSISAQEGTSPSNPTSSQTQPNSCQQEQQQAFSEQQTSNQRQTAGVSSSSSYVENTSGAIAVPGSSSTFTPLSDVDPTAMAYRSGMSAEYDGFYKHYTGLQSTSSQNPLTVSTAADMVAAASGQGVFTTSASGSSSIPIASHSSYHNLDNTSFLASTMPPSGSSMPNPYSTNMPTSAGLTSRLPDLRYHHHHVQHQSYQQYQMSSSNPSYGQSTYSPNPNTVVRTSIYPPSSAYAHSGGSSTTHIPTASAAPVRAPISRGVRGRKPNLGIRPSIEMEDHSTLKTISKKESHNRSTFICYSCIFALLKMFFS